MPNETLGGRLASLRQRAGMTQKQVGDALGREPQQVSEWETDGRRPNAESLGRFLSAVGASWGDLDGVDVEARRASGG